MSNFSDSVNRISRDAPTPNNNDDNEKRCLICNTSVMSVTARTECSTESLPETKNYHQWASSSSSSNLSKQLDVFFILKHVLELPSQQLTDYLKYCPHPTESWVEICLSCRENYLEKCKIIFSEFVQVKRRYTESRMKIIEAIQRSIEGKAGAKEMKEYKAVRRKKLDVVDICKQTRFWVLKKFELQPSSVDNDAIHSGALMDCRKENIQRKIDSKVSPSLSASDMLTSSKQSEKDYNRFHDYDDNIEFKTEESALSPQSEAQHDDCDVDPYIEYFVSENERQLSAETARSLNEGITSLSPDEIIPTKSKSENFSHHADVDSENSCNDAENSDFGDDNDYKPGKSIFKRSKTSRKKRIALALIRRKPVKNQEKKKRKELPCQLCGENCETKRRLHAHIVQHHNSEFTCPFEGCGKTFSRPIYLKRHQQTHDPSNYDCQLCGKSFKCQISFNVHLSYHKLKGKRPFKCELCFSGFIRKSDLKVHMRKMHSSKTVEEGGEMSEEKCRSKQRVTRVWTCVECDLSFSLRRYLEWHINKLHDGNVKETQTTESKDEVPGQSSQQATSNELKNNKGFGCNLCPATFLDNTSLKVHLKQIHNLNDDDNQVVSPPPPPRDAQSFQCQFCEIIIGSKNQFIKHLNNWHPERITEFTEPLSNLQPDKSSESFLCTVCGKHFTSKMNLRKHFRGVHEQKFHICCELCGKMMNRASMRSHKYKMHGVGNLPKYNCTVEGCGKSCESRTTLQRHIQDKHEGRRFFQCHFCNYNFITPRHRLRHMQAIHTNRESKPFKCEECGKGFSTKEYLRRHKKTHQPKP